MKRFDPRGQTLVLFALTLLLLTVMVCMTLSIGMKAKEKMELETAADAAAYSQAVATARAFNNISLMNRSMMGVMVAMAGVESLISWSSFYRGALEAARQAYNVPKVQYGIIAGINCPCALTNPTCAQLCSCATQAIQDISDTQDDLSQADQDANDVFESLDADAGREARSLQIGSIHDRQLEVFERLTDTVATTSTPAIAQAIADEVNRGGRFGDEVTALGASGDVNGKELVGGECTGPGAACERRNRYLHFVWAAMGSRGHAFVTGRAGGALRIRAKLIESMPANELIALENEGSGYWASSQTDSARPVDSGAAYADDHGDLTVLFTRQQSPCPPALPGTIQAWALLRSDDAMQDNDRHEWLGGQDPDPRRLEHTMGPCRDCPGMWPPHMDYNQELVADPTNVYGQPKNYAVLQRDYKVRPEFQADPWNLFFRFRFSTQDTTFDNRGVSLVSQGNQDISKAVALSAGIAYYHRVGAGWKEPPNFLNPYWRATLVGADVDQASNVPDVVSTLSGASSFAGEAAAALAAQGYAAW